jgi:succinate dehydrogenase / fumarate reductase, membrane anchor subunit
MSIPSEPKARENASLWMIKIFAGLLIVVLLGLHFIVNHMVAPNGLLSWADVVRYYKNPIIPIVEVLFLIAAVSHSLIGTRSILLDLKPGRRLLQILDVIFIGVGVTAVIYGIWLVVVVASFRI